LIDTNVMRRLADGMFVPIVHRELGDAGAAALRDVLSFLPRLYSVLSPEQITGTLYVLRFLTPQQASPVLSGCSPVEVPLDRLPRGVAQTTVIEVLDKEVARVWENAAIDVALASTIAVVYRYRGDEGFVVRDRYCAIPNPAVEHLSVFARPTFSSLLEALQDYRARLVRTSTCHLFRMAWETEQRVFFASGPEHHMRRSLCQFLYSRLRDVNVLPEQRVDETHPVDLKVTWSFTLSEALIEIKWLGKSRNGTSIVEYWDARAREGAKQLVDYLDWYRTTNPNADTKGYLVVVDGRRRSLSATTTSVSQADGMYYEHREIEYNPRYEELRSDFAPPLRLFAEPKWTADAGAGS